MPARSNPPTPRDYTISKMLLELLKRTSDFSRELGCSIGSNHRQYNKHSWPWASTELVTPRSHSCKIFASGDESGRFYSESRTMRPPTDFDDETRLTKCPSMLFDQKVCMSLCHSLSNQWGVIARTRIATCYQALPSGSLESRSPVQVMDSDIQSDA